MEAILNSQKLDLDNEMRMKIQDVKTLGELERLIDAPSDFSLKKTSSRTVFSRGNPFSRIMMIGEAPGFNEDRLGKPFVGVSGKLLDRILSSIGLSEETVYISNVVYWRPPGNRKPTEEEISYCAPFVHRHIELVSPKFLVLLGRTAAKALIGINENISKIRGQWFSYKQTWLSSSYFSEIRVLVTFHPAYLLRFPQHKNLAWSDFLLLKKELGNEPTENLKIS